MRNRSLIYVQQTPVPREAPVALQFRKGVDHRSEGTQGAHNHCKSPVVIGMTVILMIVADALSVQAYHGNRKDEL